MTVAAEAMAVAAMEAVKAVVGARETDLAVLEDSLQGLFRLSQNEELRHKRYLRFHQQYLLASVDAVCLAPGNAG